MFKNIDYAFFLGLVILAVLIWFRDTAWISTADDTLPILVALPLFYWLGKPWNFVNGPRDFSTPGFITAIVLFILGFGLNQTIILSIAWTLLLWVWLSKSVPAEKQEQLKKLLVLPLLSFPWIALDADRIGWWFRLSAAWITAKAFALVGFNVSQEGTNMMINKLPISVEVACAGLNTLQAMLIAGAVILFLTLGNSRKYWWNLPVLIAMAWFTNTFRIIFLIIVALTISPQFAMSTFHMWGGWFVIVMMFLLCWFIFNLQEEKKGESIPHE